MNKAVFIDRDGTLIKDIPYNTDPALIKLEYYACNMLQELKKKHYMLIMITNQSGVAKGFFKEENVYLMQRTIRSKLLKYGVELDGFYYCPHLPGAAVEQYDQDCKCRKPKPGLILRAAREFNINIDKSWMIGDILDDVEAGRRAGCKTIFINNGNETEWVINPERLPDFEVTNLEEATEIILKHEPEHV